MVWQNSLIRGRNEIKYKTFLNAKRFIFLALLAILMGGYFSSVLASSNNGSEIIELRISVPSTAGSPNDQMIDSFGQTLERIAPGEFKIIKLIENEALPQGTEIQAMHEGGIDMALVSPADIEGEIGKHPEAQLLNGVKREEFLASLRIQMMPFVFRDTQHIENAFQVYLDPIIMPASEVLDLKVIGHIYHGTRVLEVVYNHPITNPGQLGSRALRVPAGQAWSKVAQCLSGPDSFVTMGHAEVKTAVQNGAILALEFPLSSFKTLGLEHKFQQIILTNHLIHYLYWAISKNRWDALSEQKQKAISEAINEATQFNNKNRMDEEVRLMETYKQTFLITEPNLNAFTQQTSNVFADASLELKELVEKVKKL
ncbi:MAG: TRAP transporter substrate-binding protein DctP [Alphaproteobacteria bacterium]|nr:TRAP transporter substrate-binding protein DctP [Alphaproteobacteria bacterium]